MIAASSPWLVLDCLDGIIGIHMWLGVYGREYMDNSLFSGFPFRHYLVVMCERHLVLTRRERCLRCGSSKLGAE